MKKPQMKSQNKPQGKSQNKPQSKSQQRYDSDNLIQSQVKCLGLTEDAYGLVESDLGTLEIPYLLEDELATLEIGGQRNQTTRIRNYQGKIVKIEKRSKARTEPICKLFYTCGGCQIMHMKYPAQLTFKQQQVEKLLSQYGKVDPIVGMEQPLHYRNKIHSTFTADKRGVVSSSMYDEESRRIIPTEHCHIQMPEADKIIETIRTLMKSFKLKVYDEDREQGFLRHVLIRVGYHSKEIMVVLVTSSPMFPSKNNFIKVIREKHPEITTMLMNVNNQRTSTVLGTKEILLFGKGYIVDTLCDTLFQISAKSFYQINPVQTEKLYTKAMAYAALTGNESVLDAYCGIGTIGLIAARKAKNVIGIELNADAVKDAKINAKINKIDNTRFFQGEASDFMVECAENKEPIDVVFMDPPRSGADEKFLSSLVRLSPKRVVYISCNPKTQASDVAYLTKQGYTVEGIAPFDLFPQTLSVACVVKLERK